MVVSSDSVPDIRSASEGTTCDYSDAEMTPDTDQVFTLFMPDASFIRNSEG